MKRPLAIVALLYIGGILLAENIRLPLFWLFIVGFTLLGLSVLWRNKTPVFLPACIIVIGWINLASHTAIISPHDLRLHVGNNVRSGTFRAKLCETPDKRHYETENGQWGRTRAVVEITAMRTNANWQPARGKVIVVTTGLLENSFFKGQFVELTGVIQSPKLPVAEGLFNYRAFLERKGIYYQLDVYSTNDWALLSPPPAQAPASERILAWAQENLGRGLAKEDEALRLLWAMTLGWKPGLTDDVAEPFMRSGTMHIFAISGLHIALISWILVQLLCVLRVPRSVCGLIIIPLIWAYTGITGWQPSAIRSTIMMSVVVGGWSLKRPADLLNSLGAAALVILLLEPQQLFQASFQLSFFVVLSLAVLTPPLEKIRQRLLQHDPLLPAKLRPGWRRALDPALHWTTKSFVTSLAAWIGSAPLVAYYFHLFTPVSLIANMVIVPLSSLALMANVGSLICGGWLPWFTGAFNNSAWLFMKWMVDLSHWFAELPGGYFYLRAPTLAECIVYYLLIFGLLTGWMLEGKRRAWSMAVIGLLVVAWLCYWNAARKTWQLTILPLEGGEAVFVDAPGRKDDLLMDCGNARSEEFVTTPFLRAQGVNRLPKLLLTHGDLRNIGGASNIVFGFGVEKIIMSPARFRSPTYRQIQRWLSDTPEFKQEIKRGDELGVWRVLHPDAEDKFSQADDGPLILHGEIQGTKILFLSDLSRVGQRQLWDRITNLKADIVVAGLPRESEPLNDDLLDAIQPKLIIITDSEFPATERASQSFRDRLARRRIATLFCRDAGAITIRFQPDKFESRTAFKK